MKNSPQKQSVIAAVIGLVFMILFAAFWIYGTIASGAEFMAPFGAVFLYVPVFGIVKIIKNAKRSSKTNENGDEHPGGMHTETEKYEITHRSSDVRCPSCGAQVCRGELNCAVCGEKLPGISRK